MSKLVPIDFEYKGTNQMQLNLVCCSLEVNGKTIEFWLLNDQHQKTALKSILLELREEGYTFVSFNVEAEAHAFISLGIDPTKCKWLDLEKEWKMLTNHNHKYMYGPQLIDGKKITTYPPVYGEEKSVSNARPPKNLAGFIYKILHVEIDTEHKNEMRDIIISGDDELILKNKTHIMNYCTSDIKYLVPGWSKVKEVYIDYFKRAYKYTKSEMKELGIDYNENEPVGVTTEEVYWRGESAARTAMMTAIGYPVNVAKVKKFASSVKDLLKELCEDINSQFPEEQRFFRWNNSHQRYSMFQKPLKEWIKNSEYADRWLMTKPSKTKPDGDLSLSLEAWEKHFSFRHDYPRGNVGAQILRFLKTRQSLNGFLPKSKNAKNKETFFDSLGSDGRVRPYLNSYGSSTGRFQPKSTSYIPLKAAWMRALIEPKPGKAICGIDYGSQEFLIAALISGDKNMVEAYKSGDVYLYFAKLAGAVPWDGLKKDYKKERDVFKSTTLGISYSMGPVALATKLTTDTGVFHDKKQAQELINKFHKAYPVYSDWIDSIKFDYSKRRYHKGLDGWTAFGDNDNGRSVSNHPIQKMGGSILRKAIQLSQDARLKVIMPLHDALYIEYDSSDLSQVDNFASRMREAFGFYFENRKLACDLIRLDANIWSPDYEEGEFQTPNGIIGKKQKIYIDERATVEYEKFRKYMEV